MLTRRSPQPPASRELRHSITNRQLVEAATITGPQTMEWRKARRLRGSPSSGFSGEVQDETLAAARLRGVAEKHAKNAVKELEEKEGEHKDASRPRSSGA
ncbi:hypothetical protein AAFG13_37900 [Bradyrhizobium sp. B124]|uniref:hypothetical protein n=1 Tax=Bradyrhizobium sp. B124 TaxID=3140245 RepID=UPI0031837C40